MPARTQIRGPASTAASTRFAYGNAGYRPGDGGLFGAADQGEARGAPVSLTGRDDRGSDASGRNLANLSQQLLGELPALRIVNLEGHFGGLDQRPSDAAYAEGRGQLAQWADLGGEGFRSHACDGVPSVLAVQSLPGRLPYIARRRIVRGDT
jgi:hypothetical protein